MTEHVLYFLIISLATAFGTAAIRLRRPEHIFRETLHFFLTLTIGVTVFCVVVFALEWCFVRPLI